MNYPYFQILGPIQGVKEIASGHGLRDFDRLQKNYGLGRWRKLKGAALVRLEPEGTIIKAEIHWYEAHGIGKKEFKIKRILR